MTLISKQQFRNAAFTLVEMLVAMAITLVMMAAVVTLFANVSHSVRNQRANLELSGQIRQVRNVLQQDLQNATCPGLTWQRSESNHGYIEYIEGQYREGNATNLIDEDPANSRNPPSPTNPEINHELSTLPSSNLPFKVSTWASDGGGLGDYDDILMLTCRNEQKPFVGRMPNAYPNGRLANFNAWDVANFESQLAEVVWFAIENPGHTDPAMADDPTIKGFFGEPGMRTIYRRTLLIAPWINPYRYVSQQGQVSDTFTYDSQTFKAEPGLVRVLKRGIALEEAIASVVAFQDRYDLSVRLEWDPNLGRYKIMANTLADLTKRENRFGHFGYLLTGNNQSRRTFPYPFISTGDGYGGAQKPLDFVSDPDYPTSNKAKATAHIVNGKVLAYEIDPLNYDPSSGRIYAVRPFAFVNDQQTSNTPATVQAILNDDGLVVRVVHGPVPLWGERRGEDVMLTNALAFDIRAFDPGAPLFRHLPTDTMLSPSDPGWAVAYQHANNMGPTGTGSIGRDNSRQVPQLEYPYVGQGAYVDLGYGFGLPNPVFFSPTFSSSAQPWFFTARALSDPFGTQLAPGYTVYDTWSFHYENNGLNDDDDEIENGVWQRDDHDGQGSPTIDEGTNGLDDYGHYSDGTHVRLGVDDVGERETVPPYDKPLRGVQIILRAYERDSRAIRQVRVNQHFMPE